jgi:hypothetical protein
VQVDFAIELGRDDETLDFPWQAAEHEGLRYYDLKRHPELISYIEEAQRAPELRDFLLAVNSAQSGLLTAKCDAWTSSEINPEEEIFGAPCKFGSYIDLLFADEERRASFPEHEQFVTRVTGLLKHVPELPASAELLIRRCYYQGASASSHQGLYITFYLFGFGQDEASARIQWGIALKLVENVLRQMKVI